MFSASAILAMKVVKPDKATTETFKLKDVIAWLGASVMPLELMAVAEAMTRIVDVANVFDDNVPH